MRLHALGKRRSGGVARLSAILDRLVKAEAEVARLHAVLQIQNRAASRRSANSYHGTGRVPVQKGEARDEERRARAWPAGFYLAIMTSTVHGVDQQQRLVRFEHAAIADGGAVICEQHGSSSAEFVSGTSSVVWPVAELLSQHLCCSPELVRGKACVELGAGIGLTGAVAAALGATRSVLTDGDWGMAVLERNAVLSEERRLRCTAGVTRCEALALPWGDEACIDRVGRGAFDTVLAADVIIAGWADGHESLARTMLGLLKPDGMVLVGFEYRDDWDTVSDFQDVARSMGLVMESSVQLDEGPNLPDDFFLMTFVRETVPATAED